LKPSAPGFGHVGNSCTSEMDSVACRIQGQRELGGTGNSLPVFGSRLNLNHWQQAASGTLSERPTITSA
jgi:hypothetical protein